ncbi:hypothetical protein [Streptomyces gilvus]|uniref:hypothetical protein n=1 Tax=Streptomyces gilvus TaxID=2920937 RepID=UPI001F0DE4D7|nr:hypothetical protein [Streptomyces sp. CME 23]MCH5677849.1 hypothetical protein [Streptomyces sp. CME 23]
MFHIPSRGDVAFGIVITLLCIAAATEATVLGDYWWALAGYVLTWILARDTAGDIQDRRYARRAYADDEQP